MRERKHVGSKRKAYCTSGSLISSPSQSVCLLHSFPHIIKPPSHCFIFLFFSSSVCHVYSLCVWVFLPCMLQLFAPTVNFIPKNTKTQTEDTDKSYHIWSSYVQHTYVTSNWDTLVFKLHNSMTKPKAEYFSDLYCDYNFL